MKEIARFLIPSADDRSSLMAVLATAGYPVVLEKEAKPYTAYTAEYYVIVYEKKEAI